MAAWAGGECARLHFRRSSGRLSRQACRGRADPRVSQREQVQDHVSEICFCCFAVAPVVVVVIVVVLPVGGGVVVVAVVGVVVIVVAADIAVAAVVVAVIAVYGCPC